MDLKLSICPIQTLRVVQEVVRTERERMNEELMKEKKRIRENTEMERARMKEELSKRKDRIQALEEEIKTEKARLEIGLKGISFKFFNVHVGVQ